MSETTPLLPPRAPSAPAPTHSPPLRIHLRPAHPLEARSLAHISARAHTGDAFGLLLFPTHTTNAHHYASVVKFFQGKHLERSISRSACCIVAEVEVDGGTKVVGVAGWEPSWGRGRLGRGQHTGFVVQVVQEGLWRAWRVVRGWFGYGLVRLPGFSMEFLRRYVEFRGPRVEEVKEREFWRCGGRYWEVLGISVEPEWQGRGVGKALMRWGLEVAREDGVGVRVESSESGWWLYRSVGFREVDRWEEIGDTAVMVWTPWDEGTGTGTGSTQARGE